MAYKNYIGIVSLRWHYPDQVQWVSSQPSTREKRPKLMVFKRTGKR